VADHFDAVVAFHEKRETGVDVAATAQSFGDCAPSVIEGRLQPVGWVPEGGSHTIESA
jgi:hypothetical protein